MFTTSGKKPSWVCVCILLIQLTVCGELWALAPESLPKRLETVLSSASVLGDPHGDSTHLALPQTVLPRRGVRGQSPRGRSVAFRPRRPYDGDAVARIIENHRANREEVVYGQVIRSIDSYARRGVQQPSNPMVYNEQQGLYEAAFIEQKPYKFLRLNDPDLSDNELQRKVAWHAFFAEHMSKISPFESLEFKVVFNDIADPNNPSSPERNYYFAYAQDVLTSLQDSSSFLMNSWISMLAIRLVFGDAWVFGQLERYKGDIFSEQFIKNHLHQMFDFRSLFTRRLNFEDTQDVVQWKKVLAEGWGDVQHGLKTKVLDSLVEGLEKNSLLESDKIESWKHSIFLAFELLNTISNDVQQEFSGQHQTKNSSRGYAKYKWFESESNEGESFLILRLYASKDSTVPAMEKRFFLTKLKDYGRFFWFLRKYPTNNFQFIINRNYPRALQTSSTAVESQDGRSSSDGQVDILGKQSHQKSLNQTMVDGQLTSSGHPLTLAREESEKESSIQPEPPSSDDEQNPQSRLATMRQRKSELEQKMISLLDRNDQVQSIDQLMTEARTLNNSPHFFGYFLEAFEQVQVLSDKHTLLSWLVEWPYLDHEQNSENANFTKAQKWLFENYNDLYTELKLVYNQRFVKKMLSLFEEIYAGDLDKPDVRQYVQEFMDDFGADKSAFWSDRNRRQSLLDSLQTEYDLIHSAA